MYYLLFGFFYLFSLLPFWVIYRVSDFFYVIIYYVIGYRRKVVMGNLNIAFPEKTEKERKRIAKDFYRNFTDNWLEAIKLLSISAEKLQKRCVINFGKLPEVYATGRTCHLALGHVFNWELICPAIALDKNLLFLGVYKPVENKAIDRLFKHSRSRTGIVLLPSNDMRKAMIPYRSSQYLLALVADQNPTDPKKAFWAPFFGRPVPFAKGPEKASKAINAPLFFANIYKRKRGFYVCDIELIDENPETASPGEVTIKFVEKLEANMRAQPANWLWSHRRWKHEWKEEYRKLLVTRETSNQ